MAECPEPPNADNVECRKCGESKSPQPLLILDHEPDIVQWVTFQRTARREEVVAAAAATVARKATWRKIAPSRAIWPTSSAATAMSLAI